MVHILVNSYTASKLWLGESCGGNCSFLIAQRLLSLRGTQRRLPRQRSRDEHPCRCVVECSQ